MRRLVQPGGLAVLLCGAALVAAGVVASAAAAPQMPGARALHEAGDQAQDDGGVWKTCMPIGVETTDYLLDVVSTLPNYFGLPAKIDIHRARPLYANDECSHQLGLRQTAILLHGRTLDVSVFDVQYQDYSLMRAMALAGIDSFAFNQLGRPVVSLRDGRPVQGEASCELHSPSILGTSRTRSWSRTRCPRSAITPITRSLRPVRRLSTNSTR
jgi:hypothetical protein